MVYPPVISHSYRTWTIQFNDLPIKNVAFPKQSVKLREGMYCYVYPYLILINYIKTPSNNQGASPISSHLHVTSGASTSMIPPLVTIKCFSCGKWPWPGGKHPKNAGKTRFPAGKLICKWGTGGIWKNQTGWTWWLNQHRWELYGRSMISVCWFIIG